MSSTDEALAALGEGPEPVWRLKLPSALRMALTILALSATACAAEEPAPVVTAKKFAAAVMRGDVVGVLALVEKPVADRIGAAAERASDQVGGRRSIDPHEMMQIVDVDPKFRVARAELVAGGETTATVRLEGADGKTHDLHLVNEDGQWHVVVPLPER